MKVACLFFMVLCLLLTLACSAPPALSGEDSQNAWGAAKTNQVFPVHSPKPKPEAPALPTLNITTEPDAAANAQTITLQLDFGEFTGFYSGQLVGGLPDGIGTFSSHAADGTMWTYDGGWSGGHFNGNGTVTWEDGYVYSGQYLGDFLNGAGWESWNGLTKYEGSYSYGYYHGQGTLYNQHGEVIYSGSFYYGLISESPDDRKQRVGAFKDSADTASTEEMYASCAALSNLHAKVSGTVFDIYYNDEVNPTFCDFLLYVDGVSDLSHIICVYYTLSEGETVPSEGQSVTVWGTTGHPYSYRSVDNQSLTVPFLEAYSVE